MTTAMAGEAAPRDDGRPRAATASAVGGRVAVLAVTETVSWGVLCYAVPVLLVPMREDLGCSTAQLAGGLSLALSTLAGIPVGRWLDRHPPRSMMLAGSVLAPAWLLETVERRERAPKTIVEQIRRKRRELVLPRRLR